MKNRPDFVRIGAAIRRRRQATDHSQESFADHIEMHRTYYSAIERGEQNITLETFERVCSGLGAKMSEILKDAGE
jgi:transcriptional regulator with XRE-family HTH domain